VRLRGAVKTLKMVMRAPPATQELASADIGVLPRLPETADELRQIALSLKANPLTDIYVGLRASEARLKAMDISDVKVLAFATHGLVPGDLNGLTQPALALTPSLVSGDKGIPEDGLLQMGEILGLKINADWVVLSACNTGADKSAGADAVSGLGRAFFYAGARALLVTNWPVETTSTKLLTTELFRAQAKDAKLQRGAALRQARLRLIDGTGFLDSKSGKQVFAYAHPIFWAAFSLIGDGGGPPK
jgi:CHAT domain-containing protein